MENLRAFAEADALMARLPPERMSNRVLEYDFREGGFHQHERISGE